MSLVTSLTFVQPIPRRVCNFPFRQQAILFAVLLLTAFLLIKKKEIHKPEANQGLLFAHLLPYHATLPNRLTPRGGGGVVTPLYKPYRYVLPHRVGFCAVLVWKRVDAFPILVWNWVWFSRGLRECMNVFVVSIPSEWERMGNMRIRNGFEECFCLHSNLSNDNIIFCLKARSENGYGF